jgi:hypothetical protein
VPFRNIVRGASPFGGIPDETDILLTITGFAEDTNLSNGMGNVVWGLISEDKLSVFVSRIYFVRWISSYWLAIYRPPGFVRALTWECGTQACFFIKIFKTP